MLTRRHVGSVARADDELELAKLRVAILERTAAAANSQMSAQGRSNVKELLADFHRRAEYLEKRLASGKGLVQARMGRRRIR